VIYRLGAATRKSTLKQVCREERVHRCGVAAP